MVNAKFSNRILVLSTIPGGNETSADIFDASTNTWKVTGSTHYARAGASLLTLGNRVFAIGGNSNPSPVSLSATVEEYNVQLGTWSLAKSSLIGGRKNFAVVSVPAFLFDQMAQGCRGV